MKRIVFAFLLLPQLAFPQYNAKCFSLEKYDSTNTTLIDFKANKDTIIYLNLNIPIYGFSVSGETLFENMNDSYVRIILQDSYDYEYLVYENYPLLSENNTTYFQNTAIETLLLDGIVPQCIKIDVKNAYLQLDSYNFVKTASTNVFDMTSSIVQNNQSQYIAKKLNDNLKAKKMTWHAGITSLSEKTYEEKKAIFGGKVPNLYGLEYYKGGIFVIPSTETNNKSSSISDNYIKECDWRNRHGKNWMSPVKDQGNCGSCWAFGATGELEAYINLYFNRILNYDLSEEELLSCISNNGCEGGGYPIKAIRYFINNGIVEEDCFKYTATVQDCSQKCSTPSEKIFAEGYGSVEIYSDDNTIYLKRQLIKSPMMISFNAWKHAVTLAGYKTIELGDSIYLLDRETDNNTWVVIDSVNHSSLIGETAWLIKNSWGDTWGENGYGYVVPPKASKWNTYNSPFFLEGKITSQIWNDSDIICEDADGDGYYFWGVGPKPESAPEEIPDEPDGDDSNPMMGQMNQYGFCEDLNPETRPIDVISTTQATSAIARQYSHIEITNNATWTVNHNRIFYNGAKIIIKNGSSLILTNGSALENVEIIMEEGAILIIKENGKVHLRNGTGFTPPIGSIVEIEYGEIL